jgi:hypothetical protein
VERNVRGLAAPELARIEVDAQDRFAGTQTPERARETEACSDRQNDVDAAPEARALRHADRERMPVSWSALNR